MIVFYHQTKILINFFLYQRRLNPKYLIQPLKTLLVELTKTHFFFFFLHICFRIKIVIFY